MAYGYRRRRFRRRAATRRRSTKKNLFPTRFPMTVGSARYQLKHLSPISKAALAALVAGAVLGPVAIQQGAQLPFIGKYAAQLAAIGAKLAKKM